MNKTTLYIGLNDQKTHRQEITTLDAYKIAVNVFTAHTNGATITEAKGIYTHDNGEIVIETTLKCEIYGAEDEKIIEAADLLKAAFNQESILIEKAEVVTDFYRG